MSFSNLPPAIAAFLRALQDRDGHGLLATFAHAAVLVDEGTEHRGNALKEWNEGICEDGAIAYPINVTRRGHRTVLTVMVRRGDAGETAPAQFDWSFAIEGPKISELTITRAKLVDLPAPIARYILAANTFDLDALMATFADDAMVNDQLCEHWGRAAIKDWAARDIIGERVTMHVLKVAEHYGQAIVTANVNGDYDKRGLPDPLVLTFHFSTYQDKIIQLFILRNEPDV